MQTTRFLLTASILLCAGCAPATTVPDDERKTEATPEEIQALAAGVPTTEEEWRARLTPAQYHVLREKGTEAPFTSPLLHEKRKGTYVSADCGVPLFRSEQKYESGTGWPSFWAPIDEGALELHTDTLLGYERTEVTVKKCGGHLGHVFDDGPPPTGKRYCMNGLALRFVPDPPESQ